MNFLEEYTLLGELGKGGFATVYKVRHNELEYIRAIRVLNEPITNENSKIYQKFLKECRVLLRLGNGCHPNIVHIYRPLLRQNHALVEMDYVDGKDITHYLAENKHFVPVEEVIRMVKEMSSALAYCHEDIYMFCMDRTLDKLEDDPEDGSKVLIDEATRHRLIEKYKVIHNDIHSGNIMRHRDGSFVLLDFGLAITDGDDVRNSSRHKNGAGEYKSPEKWEDDSVLTEQSDIYSFGVVMYEYLTGSVPFPYNTSLPEEKRDYLISEAHKKRTPPPIFNLRKAAFEAKFPEKTYKQDYPDWLEKAILKCLEKDPDDRFKNGKELFEYVTSHTVNHFPNMKLLSELKDKVAILQEQLQEKDKTIANLQKELLVNKQIAKTPISSEQLQQYFTNGEACYVNKDYEKALEWYLMASDLDNCYLWAKIGYLYYMGMRGIEPNYIEAVRWFQQAALKGHPDAQFYLGCCYQLGLGLAKDEYEAKKWFSKAAKQGHQGAIAEMADYKE